MNEPLLVAMVLAPAIPGVVSLVRAFRRRELRAAKRAIRWGALSAVVAAAIFAVNAVSVFKTVAATPPDEKAGVLAAGLLPAQRALWTGVVVGMLLGLLGGIARGLAAKSEDPRAPRPPQKIS